MKKLLLVWLLFAIGNTVYAQIIKIVDGENNEPLELVALLSRDPQALILTNIQGEADISALSGAPKIEISLLGYESVIKSYNELEASAFQLSLKRGKFNLQQIVISSTRWRQPSRESPQRIASISRKEVELLNSPTTADLLGSSGEVFIQKSQLGGGSPMIRGFSTNRLLYTVDGVRMNNAIFRSGNLQNVISLDAFAIENTEVLFGPGSILYGSDAIGAVMSFETLRPEFSLRDEPLVSASATGRYATASQERTGHFDFHLGWRKWALVSSFTQTEFGDLRMGNFGPDDYLRNWNVERIDGEDVVVQNENPLIQTPTGYSQSNIMQKVAFKPNENWLFEYAFHYSATSNVPRYDRLIELRDSLPRNAEWYYGPQTWMMNQISINHNQKGLLYDEMSIKVALQNFEESRNDRRFNTSILRERTEKVSAFSANVDFLKNINSGSRIFYGLEWVQNDVRSNGIQRNIDTGAMRAASARYPNSTWSSYAAYASIQADIHPKLVLQSGLRYNGFSLDSDFSNNAEFTDFDFTEARLDNGSLTGSAGLTWRPDESWNLSTNFSTGFRAPNVDDIGKIFDQPDGTVTVPNPNLEAEYALNAEIGIAKIVNEWLKLDMSVFYTRLQNAMVRRDFSINGQDSLIYDGELSKIQAIQNAAEANVYGIQAGMEVKIARGLSLSSRLNFQRGEEELDDGTVSPSRHAAPLFGRTSLEYRHDRLRIQIYTDYSGEVSHEDLAFEERGKAFIYAADADGNPYSPSWYTISIKSQYHLNDNFNLGIGFENLSDQRYRPYSSGITGAGRNFVMSLTGKF